MSDTATANLTSRIVTLIIAIVLVALVMVPILNSLSDSSSDDSSQTITNTGTYFASTADDTAYTISFTHKERDTGGSQPECVDILAVNGNTIRTDTYTSPDTGFVPDIVVGWNESGFVRIIPNATLMGFISPSTSETVEAQLNETEEGGYTISELVVSVQNGTLSYLDWDNTECTLSEHLDYIVSNTGDYVLANNPIKVSADAEVLVYGYGIPSPPTTHYSVMGRFSSSVFSTEGAVTIENDIQLEKGRYTDPSCICTVNFNKSGTVTTITSMDIAVSYTDRYSTAISGTIDNPSIFVPTSFVVEGSGEGSPGLDPVVVTILGIIPIFVILGILVSLVLPMVTNRLNN